MTYEAPWLAPPAQSTAPVHPSRPRRPASGPHAWDDWFSMLTAPGDYIDLFPGRHFPADADKPNFRRQISAAARKRDLPVKTKFMRNGSIRLTRARSRSAVAVRPYQWDLWLNGKRHNLLPGIDYAVSEHQMVVNIHNAARRRGLRAETRHQGYHGIWLKVFPGDGAGQGVESETETP